jgi:hypothetical protein
LPLAQRALGRSPKILFDTALREAHKIGIGGGDGPLVVRSSPRGRCCGRRSAGSEPSPVRSALPRGYACEQVPYRALAKGAVAMLYGEPETSRFLAAVQRLKRQQRRKERQTRQAKQRVRVALRKIREC